MTDLTCNRTRKLLALLPGSDLPPELDQPVRDHLASCTACQRRLGDHLRVRSALGRLAAPTDPELNQGFFADLKGDILRAVAADRTRHEAHLQQVSSRRLSLAQWMTAAALLLLAVYLVPQMLATTPTLPEAGGGPASSAHHRGHLPAVGLQGQQEVLDMLDPDREGIVVLEGRTYRLLLVETPATRKDSR